VNINAANAGFYKDLFAQLGWPTLHEESSILGVGAANDASLWFVGGANDAPNDYDGRGTNHIAIGAESIADVDTVAGYLNTKNIPALFETPRHRPEFSAGPDETYYQVMFESPDKVLFEVVYTGPK